MSETWNRWQDLTTQLTPAERIKSFGYIFKPVDAPKDGITTSQLIKELPANQKKELATASLQELDNESLKSVIKSVSLPLPAENTNNILWMVFVCALSFVFIVAGVSLVCGMFIEMQGQTYFVKPEAIFTVWSTVTAYLVGLFSPSPKTNS